MRDSKDNPSWRIHVTCYYSGCSRASEGGKYIIKKENYTYTTTTPKLLHLLLKDRYANRRFFRWFLILTDTKGLKDALSDWRLSSPFSQLLAAARVTGAAWESIASTMERLVWISRPQATHRLWCPSELLGHQRTIDVPEGKTDNPSKLNPTR